MVIACIVSRVVPNARGYFASGSAVGRKLRLHRPWLGYDETSRTTAAAFVSVRLDFGREHLRSTADFTHRNIRQTDLMSVCETHFETPQTL